MRRHIEQCPWTCGLHPTTPPTPIASETTNFQFAEQLLEVLASHGKQCAFGLGRAGRRPRRVVQEGLFTEERALFHGPDILAGCAHVNCAIFDHVEHVACITLLDDDFSGIKVLPQQRFGHLVQQDTEARVSPEKVHTMNIFVGIRKVNKTS